MSARPLVFCAALLGLLHAAPATPQPDLSMDLESVQILSQPPGAAVLLQDRLLCQATPCSVKLNPGLHTLRFLLEKHLPWQQQLAITPGKVISATLTPNFAPITLQTSPPGLEILIDGTSQGTSPLHDFPIEPGEHLIQTQDPCFAPLQQRLLVQAGQPQTLTLTPQPLLAGLEVALLDQDGEVLDGDVLVDGHKIGAAPGLFPVSTCARELTLHSQEHGRHTRPLALRPKHTTRVFIRLGDTPQAQLRPLPTGFVLLSPGTFTMGSPTTERGRDPHEHLHRVTLTHEVALQARETTQRQWRQVMGSNPSGFASCGDDCPVERVNWWDTLVYLNRLSEQEGLEPCYTLDQCTGTPGTGCPGRNESHCTGDFSCQRVDFAGLTCSGYRLPTEAEWEYASRAGSSEPNHGPPDQIAWFANNSGHRTHPGGLKAPNAWGFHDMQGNVSEWVHDRFQAQLVDATDPLGDATNNNRSARGGYYGGTDARLRSAYRYNVEPEFRGSGLGLRAARTLR